MNENREYFSDQSDQEVTQEITRGNLLQQIAEVAFLDNEKDKKEFERLTAAYDVLKPDSSNPVEVVIREGERLEILEYLRQRATEALLAGNIESFDVASEMYYQINRSYSDGIENSFYKSLYDENPYFENLN